MRRTITSTMPRRRTSLTLKSWIAVAFLAGLSLLLLTVHIFAPRPELQIASLWILGLSLLSAWVGVLSWRMPVFEKTAIMLFAVLWIAGIALSVVCVEWAARLPTAPMMRLSAQWLALSISFAVGALFLRALLRRRTTPFIARLLSLLSPLAILLLILLSSAGS